MRAHPCVTPLNHQKPPLRPKDSGGWQRQSLWSDRSRSPALTTSLKPGWFHSKGKEHPCRERRRAAGAGEATEWHGGGQGVMTARGCSSQYGLAPV